MNQPTKPSTEAPEHTERLAITLSQINLDSSTPDWRVWMGLFITFGYLVLIVIYVEHVSGWNRFIDQPLDLVGSFLEGAFAPLAFLWLVIGYFLQKKELSLNTEALIRQNEAIRQTAEQSVIQSKSIAATEMHARKESFLKIADSVNQQLGVIMGFLYLSSQSAGARGLVSTDRIAELWESMSKNDPEIFSRQMLALRFTKGDRYAYKLFYGTPTRTRHSLNFIFHFERMLNAAAECDHDGMISDALVGTTHGYIYNLALEFRDSPPDPYTFDVYDFDPDSIE